MILIEIIIEFLVQWLGSGADGGKRHKFDVFIAYTVVLGLAALGIYLYVINFGEMSFAVSIIWGFAIILFYSTIFAIYWAMKRAAQDKVGE